MRLFYGAFQLLCFLYLTAAHVPFQLISPDESHENLEVVEEGLLQLSKIESPIAIVAAVGPYHSGKSFLLNILRDSTSGFKVGPTINPETHGLWLLETDLETDDGAKIFFLDTEGFYGNEASEAYDAKIFAITALLSSHLIFNSVRVIDQATIDYLELLSRRAHLFSLVNYLSSVKSKARDTGTEQSELPSPPKPSNDERTTSLTKVSDALTQSEYQIDPGFLFPHLSWVVQDFWQDMDGVSHQEWLNQYLEGKHRDTNFPAEERGLDKIFTNGISCHTIFLPATDHKFLRDLSTIQISQLTSKFKEDIGHLKLHILSKLESKKSSLGNDGASLSALLRFYVNSANRETFPRVPSLWRTWITEQAENAKNDGLKFYENSLSSFRKQDIPVNQQELVAKHIEIKDKAIHIFRHLLFNMKSMYSEYEKTLEKLIEDKYRLQRSENVETVHRYIQKFTRAAKISVENTLHEVDLPLPKKDILERTQRMKAAFTKKMNEFLGKFQSADSYADEHDRIISTIESQESQLLYNNEQKISQVILDASKLVKENYDKLMHKTEDRVTTKILKELHTSAKKTALQDLVQYFTTQEREWITKEDIYKLRVFATEKELDERLEKFIEENEKRVFKWIEDVVRQTLLNLKQTLSNVDMPQEEDVLIKELKSIASKVMSDFEKQVEQYNDLQVYKKEKARIQNELHQKLDTIKETNMNLMASYQTEALLCAKKILDQEECSFCLVKYSEPYLEKYFTQIARNCMQKGVNDKTLPPLSETTQRGIIDLWLSKELGEARSVVQRNRSSYLIVFPGIALFTFAVWILMKVFHVNDLLLQLWINIKTPFLKLGCKGVIEWIENGITKSSAFLSGMIHLGLGVLLAQIFLHIVAL